MSTPARHTVDSLRPHVAALIADRPLLGRDAIAAHLRMKGVRHDDRALRRLLKELRPRPGQPSPHSFGSAPPAEAHEAAQAAVPEDTAGQVDSDSRVRKLTDSHRGLDRRYQHALSTIDRQRAEMDALLRLQKATPGLPPLAAMHGDGTSEATAFIIASDWHVEEPVRPATVDHLNEFDLGIAQARIDRFFNNSVKLLRIFQKDVKIDRVVLALLGDFISNDIHEELAEENQLLPVDAALWAQQRLARGIEFILEHTAVNLVIPCHSGNHARTTPKQRVATERGHSLEYLMYHALSERFRHEPRVKFHLAEGYHSHMDVYGDRIRFHHGHGIRFQGGVGGLYIPAHKAIAQWNKARRASLDVFGHWHQLKFGGPNSFICNGSLIGYSPYALWIKAEYEKPQQAMFLWDRDRGLTFTAPIYLEGN